MTQKPTALAIAQDKNQPLDKRVDSIRALMFSHN